MSGTSPAMGYKGYLQFGRESTWGTAVAATKRLPFIRETVKPIVQQVKRVDLNNTAFRQGIVNVAEQCAGQIELYLSYEGLNLLWDGIFGTASFNSNGGTTAGTNPYTHTFIPREFYNSYTIEIVDGNIPASKCKRVIGGKITGFTINAGLGDAALVRITLDIIGKQCQVNQTPTAALTAITQNFVLSAHASTYSDGTSDASNSIRSIEFAYKNGLAQRPQVGSLYTDEPIRADFPMATIKVTKERQFKTLKDSYIAGTSMAPLVTFTDSPRSLTLQMDTAKITDLTEDTDGYGIQTQDVTFEGIDTSGSFDMKAIVVNAQALITT